MSKPVERVDIMCSSVIHAASDKDSTRTRIVRHKLFGPSRTSRLLQRYSDTDNVMPSEYIKWPDHTDQWCFHDGHPFDSVPIPAPISYDDKRDIYTVDNMFCSFSCALKYLEEACGHDRHLRSYYLHKMAKEVFGHNDNERIFPAPERRALAVHGGPYSIEKFREISSVAKVITRVPPFLPQGIVFEERHQNADGFPDDEPQYVCSGTTDEREPFQITGLRAPKEKQVAPAVPQHEYNPEHGLYAAYIRERKAAEQEEQAQAAVAEPDDSVEPTARRTRRRHKAAPAPITETLDVRGRPRTVAKGNTVSKTQQTTLASIFGKK